jgi:glycosyltransferase involved in cell wall biosynthesis
MSTSSRCMDSLPQFTGIVVTYNEARRLRECLRSLAFCEQLVVIDLGSTDSSIDIAKECGARVVPHARVQVVEQVWGEAMTYARNDWVVLLDPDEILPADIANEFRAAISKDPLLGMIRVPRQFYFKGTPLHCTVWGINHPKHVVFHKHRNSFCKNVHKGVRLLDGYTVAVLSGLPNWYIEHYWADSYWQLFEKHWRYVKREGESRFQQGERFSWRRWAKETRVALQHNLIDLNGLRGGFVGIFLSFFYAWYVSMSLLSLRRYQKLVEQGKAASSESSH